MVLLRRLLGDVLRRHRIRQSRTLRDVSSAAGVSLGYLSEVERGRKEASSELLAAICDALELPLAELLHTVASDLSAVEEVQVERVPAGAAERDAGAAASAAIEGGRLVPAVVGDNLADLRLQPVLSHRLDTSITRARAGAIFAA